MTPLTVPEARAILAADRAIVSEYESTFGVEDRDAWERLAESARDRLAAWDSSTLPRGAREREREEDVVALEWLRSYVAELPGGLQQRALGLVDAMIDGFTLGERDYR